MSYPTFIRMSDIEWTPELIAQIRQLRQWKHDFDEAESMPQKWAIIRQAYDYLTPIIMQRAENERYLGMTNPYILNWGPFFSPIEYDAWCSIRYYGIGLFPQYPVGNVFIDFANPYLKIGLELDGKDWHDEERDRVRDEKLAEKGWKIFRIRGFECYTKDPHLWDIQSDWSLTSSEQAELIRSYFLNTSDGIIRALDIIYFSKRGEFRSYAFETLNTHRLAQFDI